MGGKLCNCGEVLSDTIFPNDLEWHIYYKKELENVKKIKFQEYSQDLDDFDYFWLCPRCKRCHVWLNTNREHEEFRIYEYRVLNEEEEKIIINDLIELYLFSTNDENEIREDITIDEVMKLILHKHRYFINKQESVVYLYNVNTNQFDGKYIIKYSDTNLYDIKITEDGILAFVKKYDGIETYFDEDMNEAK